MVLHVVAEHRLRKLSAACVSRRVQRSHKARNILTFIQDVLVADDALVFVAHSCHHMSVSLHEPYSSIYIPMVCPSSCIITSNGAFGPNRT